MPSKLEIMEAERNGHDDDGPSSVRFQEFPVTPDLQVRSPDEDLMTPELGCSSRRLGSPIQCADENDFRVVHVNNPSANEEQRFCSNVVITSKYTPVTFVPKILFLEFSKLANAYFLVVSILQTIPLISNTGGYPASLPTLIIIIMVDAIFAAMEDIKRHKADDICNNQTTCRLNPSTGEFDTTKWIDVKVGDILKIKNHEDIPADVLILAVDEDPERPPTGICYVETKSLDGETNLKLRQGVECTYSSVRTAADLLALKGRLVCEKPNNAIHKFTGLFHHDNTGTEEVVSHTAVLLRGCSLRNSNYIYGLVFNTGDDTKIMMSVDAPPTKWSTLEKNINVTIKCIVAVMFFLCVFAASLSLYFNLTYLKNTKENAWYLPVPNKDFVRAPAGQFFVDMVYFFLLMNQFIPISLYVSMTSIKFLQSYFLVQDVEMYHEETDTPALCRTMALNEELGQIDYIFSDKTGTLTCNIMEFRKLSVNGVSYGKGTTEIGRAAQRRQGIELAADPMAGSTRIQAPYVNFDDSSFLRDLEGESGEEQRKKLQEMLEHLSVCHTVIPENVEGEGVRLSASSPDEQALVAGAAALGYEFYRRAPGEVWIRVRGKSVKYEVLDVLEFNSTRKRMSVIIRTPEGKVKLLCKGADTVICERIKKSLTAEEELGLQRTLQHMSGYAAEGLRTLLVASSELDEEVYQKWSAKFSEANSNLLEIEKRKNGEENRIDQLMESVERELSIIGATAIEDKLQEGVPDTIADLRKAGIKVWMLTGDKEETAINIGFACELLALDMFVLTLNGAKYGEYCEIKEELVRQAAAAKSKTLLAPLHMVEEVGVFSLPDALARSNSPFEGERALVIDGEALLSALQLFPSEFIEYAMCCSSVVACRVSPAQKAQIVDLVKTTLPKSRTLAIGDGANDVSMIQTAHVGVGISGQEGMQAVNSSDYAIAQFRFLRRLLLVHGRWNYIRMSKLVCFTFYKNIMMCLTQFWYFVFLTGFSGQKFYLEVGIQMFNLLYTSLPPILLGIFDQDVPDYLAQKFPHLYSTGLRNSKYNFRVVLYWFLSCIYESAVICFGVVYAYRLSGSMDGATPSVWEMGAVVFSIVIIVVNVKLMLIQCIFHWIHWVIYAGSVALWFCTAELASNTWIFSPGAWYLLWGHIRGNILFYLLLVLIPVAALGRDFLMKGWKRNIYPEYYHLVQEVHANKWEQYADYLLSYPPPEKLPLALESKRRKRQARVETPEVEVVSPDKASQRRPVEELMMDKLPKSELSLPEEVLRNSSYRGAAFGYDSESILAQSYMAAGHEGTPSLRDKSYPRLERAGSLYGNLFDHIVGPTDEELELSRRHHRTTFPPPSGDRRARARTFDEEMMSTATHQSGQSGQSTEDDMNLIRSKSELQIPGYLFRRS